MISYEMKLVILGDGSVGKTSLRRQYLGKGFPTNYLPTIGADFSVKTIKLDRERPIQVRVAIWDIAGQPLYKDLATGYFKGSQGAFVVYDVSNPESFETISHWINHFKDHTLEKDVPVVILGNKTDLDETITAMDQLSLLQKLAKLHPKTPIYSYRTSAKTGDQVEEAFSQLISVIIEQLLKHEIESTKETETEVNLWEFGSGYFQVELVRCKHCELYVEADSHQLDCPSCGKILVVKDRIQGFVRTRKS